MKILHIINNLKMGGAENFLTLLANEQSQKNNCEIILVCLEQGGTLEKKLSSKVHVKKFNYHLFLPFFSRFDPFFRIGLYLFVKKIDPDIIHGHLLKSDMFSKTLGLLLRKPVFLTQHDTIIANPGKRYFMTNKYLTGAIAVSDSVAGYLDRVFKIDKQKIIVIPDGVKASDFPRIIKKFDPQEPVFIYTGRLIKLKGIDLAIEGLAKLQREIPGLKFLIFGEGEELSNLQNLCKRKNYKFVEFKNRVNDITKALRQGDIYVMPSKSEGFSMATLEAAISGLPVIGTKTGAIPEIIKDNESGFMVNPGSSQEIYLAAKKMINTNSVERFGIAARKSTMRKYDIKKVTRMYCDLYLKKIPRRGV